MTILEGANAKRNSALVTDSGELCTRSITVTRELDRAVSGFRFATGTGELSLPASFDGPVLWFRNDDNDRNFILSRIIVSWNGGTATRNLTCLFQSIRNAGEPAANANTSFIGNTNFGSTKSSLATAYQWDGTGTAGMDTTPGSAVATRLLNQGSDTIQPGGAILPAGSSISMNLKPDEAGVAAISLIGYFEELEIV